MMFAEMHYLETLPPQQLDNYLRKGWFRMNQTIFTTHFLQFNQHFYSAIWLRIGLTNYVPDKKHLQLQKINSGFRTEIRKAEITKQQEELFALYKQGISFEPASSLHQLLLGNESDNKFDSYEVNVYDGALLIATGYFDLGYNSAAGIICFYHPNYKKYSLGKFLMFLKIDFCRQQKLDYFYPGYIVPNYAPFEYKASVGKAKLEYFEITTQQWLLYTTFLPNKNPLQEMSNKLDDLQAYLTQGNIVTKLMNYRFFDANLYPSCTGLNLFDFPIFLTYKLEINSGSYLLIVYDIQISKYRVIECISIGKVDFPVENDLIFGTHLLKLYQEWLSSTSEQEIADLLVAIDQASIPQFK